MSDTLVSKISIHGDHVTFFYLHCACVVTNTKKWSVSVIIYCNFIQPTSHHRKHNNHKYSVSVSILINTMTKVVGIVKKQIFLVLPTPRFLRMRIVCLTCLPICLLEAHGSAIHLARCLNIHVAVPEVLDHIIIKFLFTQLCIGLKHFLKSYTQN